MKLIKRKIGLEVASFFEEEMFLGDRCCLPNLAGGSFTLYCPPTINEDNIYNFKSGGHSHDFYQENPPRKITTKDKTYWAKKIPDISDDLHSCIVSFFEQEKIKECLINDILSPNRNGDGVLSILKSGNSYEFSNTSGYEILTAAQLLKPISEIYLNWHFLCIGTNSKVQSVKRVWKDIIKKENENINLIIIGIYDGEGFVVWDKFA